MTLRCTCPDDVYGATIRCPIHGVKAEADAATVNHRHEVGMLLAEIERLREYERMHGVRSNEIGKLRQENASLRRALAAGPAALRAGAPSLWSGESAAREVEAAQVDAMKERP